MKPDRETVDRDNHQPDRGPGESGFRNLEISRAGQRADFAFSDNVATATFRASNILTSQAIGWPGIGKSKPAIDRIEPDRSVPLTIESGQNGER